ncbi:hypothetical protein AB4Z22_26315, partial [Paenibacillus sp. TAF58]
AILSLMVTGAAFANDEHPNKHAEKKTGLENALERGNKNETAREAIRRAMERKQGKNDQNNWTIEQRVAADLKELEITFGGTDSKNQVTQAMALRLQELMVPLSVGNRIRLRLFPMTDKP